MQGDKQPHTHVAVVHVCVCVCLRHLLQVSTDIRRLSNPLHRRKLNFERNKIRGALMTDNTSTISCSVHIHLYRSISRTFKGPFEGKFHDQ